MKTRNKHKETGPSTPKLLLEGSQSLVSLQNKRLPKNMKKEDNKNSQFALFSWMFMFLGFIMYSTIHQNKIKKFF